ncbi:delta-aminolevulinic acid dehydratase [Petrimonas sulfuriphila]|uniref:delta-aminolevulinic acid dehydratase n=1 Tax=Petrimonas sulfuriphila TaxID=285070 RepID=UPI003EBB3EB2
MSPSFEDAFHRLRIYCEKEDFAGWDPYDGLNSKVFQALPFFKHSALCRLVVIQGFKRSPVNLRRIALVPKEHNAKGIALFLSGYCNLYHAIRKGMNLEISPEDCLEKIHSLVRLLLSLKSKGYSGACWGYNFDWQSKAFFLPRYTPTIVATSFVVEALLSAYEITKCEEYLSTALSATKFILLDLNRISKEKGYMFSYSPLDCQAVYNASLLGTKTLSLAYYYTNDEKLKIAAYNSAQAVCNKQNPDGSFPHSDQVGNKWRDNFHTAFKLESLCFYQRYCNDNTFNINLKSGYHYWIEKFFIKERGIAKYYDTSNENSLIDLHCVAQTIPTLYKLGELEAQKELTVKILDYAINSMQEKKQGYFYFQKGDKIMNKIPYMRWPNAWMFYGLSYFILFDSNHDKTSQFH